MRDAGTKLGRSAVHAAAMEALESRQLFSVLTVGPALTYPTIQSAVNAANTGDTILVTPGTYVEQVSVPSTKTNLLIEAQNPQSSAHLSNPPANATPAQLATLLPDAANSSIIMAPASMTSPKAIVTDAGNNLRLTGFVIEGPGGGASDSLEYGVYVSGATNVEIDHNHVNHIHDNPTSGDQTGIGIYVTNGGSANIHDNLVSDYQKAGIEVTGTNSLGTVTNNTVLGDGPTAVIDQNGIEFTFGAGGSITTNLVTGNVYAPQTAEDGGIELFNSAQTSITGNTSYNNDGDIILDGASRLGGTLTNLSDYANGSMVENNTVYGATYDGIELYDGANSVTISGNTSTSNYFDGILIDNSSQGNQISNNTFTGNNTGGGTAWDIEDDTYGQNNSVMGDYGTGNFYSGDTFNTSNFPITTTTYDTIFQPTDAPASNLQNVNDPGIPVSGVELGIKFQASVNGTVAGVRFYKGTLDTGVHTGELWTLGGTELATVTFTNETASGWQQALFGSPVSITANTTYIVSYHTDAQYIAYTPGGLTNAINNPPLTALSSSSSGGNGVYHYGATALPTTYNGQSPNYWVDVDFTPSATPPVTDTIFHPTDAPASNLQNVNDPNIPAGGVELGTKFTSSVAGDVTGVRFYKGTLDTGVHTGELWTIGGTELATVTFTGETASGWQQATFGSPVLISANTTYIISYHTDAQYIAYTPGGLLNAVVNQPLTALASSASGGNGVYEYGATAFPNVYNGQSPNYWVDVTFTPTQTVNDSIFFPNSAPPSYQQDVSDPNIPAAGVELGTKFESDVAGMVTGVLFYKGAGETGVQTGELWTAGGTLLATATFSSETASGWQMVTFNTPVSIAANTVYIVSYHTTSTTIAYTPGGLSSSVDNPPLHALASGSSGGNGVYEYGASAFPTVYNGQSPNYWVDVAFTPS
jgi:parallel beta-helix repeat protein